MGKLSTENVRTVNLVVFSLAALMHLIRLVTGKFVPVWASYVAIGVLLVLLYLNYQNK